MAVLETLKPRHRKPKTLERLMPTWGWIKPFLKTRLEADGYAFCVEDVMEQEDFVTAALIHAYETQTAIAAVKLVGQAVKMAMQLSGVSVEK